MWRWKVHWKAYKMNGSISVHILTSFPWECGNLTRPWLSHGKQKKPTDLNVLLKSTITCPIFSPDVFKVAVRHTLNLQEFGRSSISTGRWQIHWAAALGTLHLILSGGLLLWQGSQNNTALPGPDIVQQHTARKLTNFYLCLFHSPSHG